MIRAVSTMMAALLLAGPAFAQRLGQGEGAEVPVWRVLIALLLCLGLAVAAAFVLRRRLGGPGPAGFGRTKRLQLVETLRLSHQVDLCVVACDGGEFMVAATPHGATLIKPDLPAPAPVPEEARP
jgi:hypothetical protein